MYPTSFFCLLHFVLLSVFVLTSPRKTNYLSIIYGHLQAVLWGCFAKIFTPHYNWKVTSRLSGYFTKILQKIAENFSRQSHIKRKSDITQTSFSIFITLSLKIKGYNLLFHKTHNYVYWNTIRYSIDNVP